MKRIEFADIAAIARGAAILGAGGGGDPYLGSLLAELVVAENGPVEVVDLDAVPLDAVVVPVAIMGAPTVIVEKPPASGQMARTLLEMETALGRKATHIACFEAGGLNSMTPIIAAAETGLPLIDADGMGRAFPELQMVLMALDGVPTSPMAMVDDKGNSVIQRTVDNHWAERLARTATVEMGCSASIALYPMTGRQARTGLVAGTVTLAKELGDLVTACRQEHRDAARAISELLAGKVLFTGKVTDVSRRTTGGFARGEATLAGLADDAGAQLILSFQNEHLVARRNDLVVASVPDLICVLDAETGQPVTTEALRYGFRVTVIGLPCHPRWRTDDGLALVGPGYFGYDHAYVPIDKTP